MTGSTPPTVASPVATGLGTNHLPDAVVLDIRLTQDEIHTLEQPYPPRPPTGF